MTKPMRRKRALHPIQEVTPPRQRVCQDITIEKYVELLSVNPGGRPRCAKNWQAGSARSGATPPPATTATTAQFYCYLRDGAPFGRQIKSAKDVHLPYCAGSFLAAVQADRLMEFKLPTTDGLFQRFMPQMMREARGYQDTPEADDAKVLLRPLRDQLVALVRKRRPTPTGKSWPSRSS